MASELEIREAYAMLGLLPGAAINECREAWQELRRMWDADLFSPGSREHTRALQMRNRIDAAFELLQRLPGNPAAPIQAPPAAQVQPAVQVQVAPRVQPAPQTAQPEPLASPNQNRQAQLNYSNDYPDGQFEAARQLESTGQLPEAVRAYQRLGQIGHLKAQFRLGLIFCDSIMKDLNQAAYWWKRAADAGHVGAQFNLGLMYERGIGMPLDRQQAMYWFAEASYRGDQKAKEKLAALSETNPAAAQQAMKSVLTPGDMQALMMPGAPAHKSRTQAGQTQSPTSQATARDYVNRKPKVS